SRACRSDSSARAWNASSSAPAPGAATTCGSARRRSSSSRGRRSARRSAMAWVRRGRPTTGRREELLRDEAAGWEELTALVDGLDGRELEAPGVTPDGWSVKDVAWHVAAWSRDTARVLREIAAGTWDGIDPSSEPGWADRTNAEWFERSRAMAPGDVSA